MNGARIVVRGSANDGGTTMEAEGTTAKAANRRGPPPSTLSGTLWFGGWLFTIGFAKLAGWKVLLAILAWPYYLGSALG
jgi:hypothetical protein